MPAFTIFPVMKHDCCKPRWGRHCHCWCHDVVVEDWSLRSPTLESFRHKTFGWHVSGRGGHPLIGNIYRTQDGKYAVNRGADIPRTYTDSPWEAVRVLAEWSRT